MDTVALGIAFKADHSTLDMVHYVKNIVITCIIIMYYM